MSESGKIATEGGLRSNGVVKQNAPELPLISIITVVRNGAVHLRETIESVLGQNWPNIEYIIIDGDSTDGTLDIIRSYDQRIDYWASEPDKGIFDAMNKGITLAHGELIGLLNADDWYEPGAIETAAAAFCEMKLPGIYYGDKYFVQVDMGLTYEFPASLEFWRGMTICHQAMFVHHDVYLCLGCYDLTYRLAADFDFFVRAIRKDVTFIPLNRYVVNFRDDGASSKALVSGNREIGAIIRKEYGCFSSIYLKNLFTTAYGLTAVAVSSLVRWVMGKRIQHWARSCYYRLFTCRGDHVQR